MRNMILKLLVGAVALTFFAGGAMAGRPCVIATDQFGPNIDSDTDTNPINICEVTDQYIADLISSTDQAQNALGADLIREREQDKKIANGTGGPGAKGERGADGKDHSAEIGTWEDIPNPNFDEHSPISDDNPEFIESDRTTTIKTAIEGVEHHIDQNIIDIQNNTDHVDQNKTNIDLNREAVQEVSNELGTAKTDILKNSEQINGNKDAIAKETHDRENAILGVENIIGNVARESIDRDDALGGRIDAERTESVDRDDALGERITTESEASVARDDALDDRIDTETADRVTADDALRDGIEQNEEDIINLATGGNITAVEDNRRGVDTNKSNINKNSARIDNNSSRIDGNSARINENKQAIKDSLALSLAIPSDYVSPGKNGSIAGGVGFTDGAEALGITASIRFNPEVTAYVGGSTLLDSDSGSNDWALKAGARYEW